MRHDNDPLDGCEDIDAWEAKSLTRVSGQRSSCRGLPQVVMLLAGGLGTIEDGPFGVGGLLAGIGRFEG